MAGFIEDRWRVKDAESGKAVPSRDDGQGARWRARYKDATGKEHARRFPTRIGAQRWLDGITTQQGSGTYSDPKGGRITLASWAARWLDAQSQLKPTTRARYDSIVRVHLVPRFGTVRLADLTHADVSAWVSCLLAAGMAPATVRQTHRVLSLILGFAVRDGRLARNVAEGVNMPRAGKPSKRFLTMTEALDLAEASGQGRLVILTLALTGLRFGELVALRVGRVDLLRRRIDVVESASEVGGVLHRGTTKTHQRRSVPIPRFLVDELAALAAGKGGEDLLFTAPGGGPVRLMNFRRRVFDPAVRAAGLDGLTPHELRHTAASLAVSAGANVKAVQRLLGHASAAMTLDVYSGLFDDELDALADRLDLAVIAGAETLRKLASVSAL